LSVKRVDIDDELNRLEEKIAALASCCEQLREENRSLKASFAEWAKERAQSAEKTAIAKNRVEAMISRLKSMGHES